MSFKLFIHAALALSTAILVFVTLSTISCGEQTIADVVFVNGTIYTVNADFSVAEAVAIKGNKIVAAGTTDEVQSFIDDSTKVIDLEGKAVIPGLVDSHAHIISYGLSLDRLDLVGTGSAEEIAELVRAKAEELGPGEWILGRGWDQNDWPEKKFPTHEVLDEAAPDNPVILTRIDGHAIWVNARAMEIGNVTRETQNPDGGEIIRDEEGNPTGVFIDAAESLVNQHVPAETDEYRKEQLVKAIQNCQAVGLVGVHDMGGGPSEIAIMRELIDEGKFQFRVYFNLRSGLSNLDELLAAGHQNYGDGRLVVRSVKTFIDGALGSRGAAFIEPYSDRTESTGLLMQTAEELEALAEKCLRAGFQLSTHAIGDLGNRITLDAFEQALAAVPTEDARLRIEHAQIVALDDIPRFKELGVLPSMQPVHCTSDFPWALDRVGPERAKGAYAWRKFLDTDVIIPCGSDFPVEDINPMHGFYAAITRQHGDGTPEGGYFPEEKMTREEALKGFTIWAATAAFAENELGSLEVGKKADLVVLDRDIMKVPELEVLETLVEMTVVDGKIVYERGPEEF